MSFFKPKVETQPIPADCGHMVKGFCFLKRVMCSGRCNAFVEVQKVQGWNDRNPGSAGTVVL